MRGVDAHLKRLKPVALKPALEGKCVTVWSEKAVEVGKWRRGLVLRPKPCKEDSRA